MRRLEPLCTKTGRATGFLQEKDCFEPNPMTTKMEEVKKAQTKVCKECGRELPVEMFGRHAKTKDGLQPLCKDCRSRKTKIGFAKKSLTPEVAEKLGALEETVNGYLKKEQAALAAFTDAELCNELAHRGWSGEVHRVEKRQIKLEDL